MQKEYYRVLSSRFTENEETKKMIGGIFEARNIDFTYNIIALYTEDKEDWYWFNFSDFTVINNLIPHP